MSQKARTTCESAMIPLSPCSHSPLTCISLSQSRSKWADVRVSILPYLLPRIFHVLRSPKSSRHSEVGETVGED
eukprot:760652-Hanusia_phi.AAC.6